jgi:hypothetical protein
MVVTFEPLFGSLFEVFEPLRLPFPHVLEIQLTRLLHQGEIVLALLLVAAPQVPRSRGRAAASFRRRESG